MPGRLRSEWVADFAWESPADFVGMRIDLRTRVDERIRHMRENGVPELRAQFSEAAAALGLSLDEVSAHPKSAGVALRSASNPE